MVVSSKQLWAVLFVTTAFMVCEVVKVDGKGLVIKTPLASFNGLFTASKGHSNRKGLISS
jgi:hypothetical protein